MSDTADFVRRMTAAGAPPEAIAVAFEEIGRLRGAEAERKRKRAEQKAKERRATIQKDEPDQTLEASASPATVARLSRDSPPQEKEIPPTPPKENSTPPISPPQSSNELFVGLVDAPSSTPAGNAENIVHFKRREPNGDAERLKALGEDWNALARQLGLPLIEEIKPGSTRWKHASARLRENSDTTKIFNRIRGSPLLRGEGKGTGWRCTFDWLIRDSNWTKVSEGNYEVSQSRR